MAEYFSVLKRAQRCCQERRLPLKAKKVVDLLQKARGYINHDKVVIETSNLCNARCVWCWMYTSGKKDSGLMHLEDFRKIIDLNRSFFRINMMTIVPYHRGEPLIHPHFFDMIDYAAKRNIILGGIDTNLSVNIDILRLIESPLRFILVNVGGTTREVHEMVMRRSDFELVKKNLRELFQLNHKNIPISVKMNPTKHNLHQIPSLRSFVDELGGSAAKTIIGKTGFTLPSQASKDETDTWLNEVVTRGMDEYLRFAVDSDGKIRAKVRRCSFLVPTVKWDGKVTICCHDQFSQLNLGNALTTPLKNIIRSKEYRIAEKKGRMWQLPFCKECN